MFAMSVSHLLMRSNFRFGSLRLANDSGYSLVVVDPLLLEFGPDPLLFRYQFSINHMKNKADIAPIGTAIRNDMPVGTERSSFVGEYLSHIANAPESKTQKNNHMNSK